jgi:DNA repair exonuclease SbcCD ATPase subunit
VEPLALALTLCIGTGAAGYAVGRRRGRLPCGENAVELPLSMQWGQELAKHRVANGANLELLESRITEMQQAAESRRLEFEAYKGTVLSWQQERDQEYGEDQVRVKELLSAAREEIGALEDSITKNIVSDEERFSEFDERIARLQAVEQQPPAQPEAFADQEVRNWISTQFTPRLMELERLGEMLPAAATDLRSTSEALLELQRRQEQLELALLEVANGQPYMQPVPVATAPVPKADDPWDLPPELREKFSQLRSRIAGNGFVQPGGGL